MQANKEKGAATNGSSEDYDASNRTKRTDNSTSDDEVNFNDTSETIGVAELLSFDRYNDILSLIGNRWLCKGKSAAIQGPTGIGKSSLVMQWAIRLILNLPFFGIKATGPMRVLIIQAEND